MVHGYDANPSAPAPGERPLGGDDVAAHDSRHARTPSVGDADVRRLMEQTADWTAADSATLLQRVYGQLRALAAERLRHESAGHTLAPTALVHEAYLRLVGRPASDSSDQPGIRWQNRGHFFAAAAESMRRVLIDHARAKGRDKRGGKDGRPPKPVPLDLMELAADDDPQQILSVDDALQRLEAMDAPLAHMVRLRFFAGLTEAETAEVLGVSDRTVRRDWTVARAWLRRFLDQREG